MGVCLCVCVCVCAPASRWETATFLQALYKNTGLLVWICMLCVCENQQFSLTPVLFSPDDDG